MLPSTYADVRYVDDVTSHSSGRMNASVAKVMAEAGMAINNTFGQSVAKVGPTSGRCKDGVAVLTLSSNGDYGRGGSPLVTTEFDYVMIMEDLTNGQ